MKTGVFSLVLIILVVLTQPLSANEQNPDQLFLKGLAAYYHSDYEQALNLFDDVLALTQYHQDTLYYQTLAQIKLNNIVEAKKNIAILKQHGYEFGYLYWKLGTVYLNKDQQFDSPFYNEARLELEKAQMLGINSSALYSDLAMAYHGLGNLEMAAEKYRIALSQGGTTADYINLASIYKEMGQIDQAIEIFNTALTLKEDMSIYLSLGNLYLQKEDYASAVKILEKGQELNPLFIPVTSRLAQAYYYYGNISKAKGEFTRIINEKPDNYRAYYYLGEISVKYEEDIPRAIYYYNEAIKYNPDYVKAYIAVGNIYLEQGNNYKAIAQYTSAIEKNPNYPDGHYYLALVYYRLNMKEAAIAELRKTLHLNPNFKDARAVLSKLQED